MGSANSKNNYNSDESIGSCEGNSSHTDPTIYFRNLDLQYFVEEPLTMLNSYKILKNEFLATDHPRDHYIQGLLQYFQHCKSIEGLNHLRQSANGNFDNGTYIYGMLMLCRAISVREKSTSISYHGKLIKSELQCLTMIKNSLKEIRVILKTKYLTNTATREPLTDCHNHDMDSACEDCYYFKRMNEFVDYISTKKQ